MRKTIRVLACALALAGGWSAAGDTCKPTGFFRDGINMTAALIDPPQTVTGVVNAAGCNIGVYYDAGYGTVNKAEIYGANYFGIAVNGDIGVATVNVLNSNIHNIGEQPLNGTQHGVGIYYRTFGTGAATGKISGNTVAHYQKGGIVANGEGTTVNISDNVVTGEGAVDYIAQNGIQVGYGGTAQVMRNTVTGNAYTGNWGASSGGIIVVGGACYGGSYTTGTQIVGNTVANNDVGVYLSNLDENCGAPATPTNVKVTNNTISNAAITNVSGLGYPRGYQAGVSDVGNNDKIINNKISGIGYTYDPDSNTYAVPIDADTSFTNRPKVHANK